MKNNSILKNDSGMAIMMVMSVIAILAFLLADFTFESKINKIKVYNQQDKLQARLNAEAGLNLALAKLKLYQEGRNLIEKNKQLKEFIQPSMIESVITMDNMFPIILPPGANILQKTAINEFEKNSLIRGRLNLSISTVSGFLNPNNLRVSQEKSKKSNDPDNSEDEESTSPHDYIEKKLLETLNQALEKEKEKNEEFDEIYGNVNAELLIKELKFFVNDPKNFNDSERAEIEATYLAADIIPKHAPLNSIDELHLLLGWNDSIVKLFKDKLTVHEVSIIAVNELTEEQLKLLFPSITPVQIEEFFKHRDGDEELKIKAQEFKSEKDFKELVVNKLAIVDNQTYDDRKKEYEQAGLRIAVAGKLYKISSKGFFGRAEYSITAFADLPIKPEPEPEEEEKNKNDPNTDPNNIDKTDTTNTNTDPDDDKEDKEEEKPIELLSPRIIEVRIE
ncbi:hypothetical protein A9Q84_11765 [Halobacteriovorax marinus]|uniref:Uncharacterized protein n=1 Tax=Halobacteriovorax marinus TaxID=97084 RepID=A0A1Y5F8C2_9BACT|nr:hypothetical protein A9Q84_11765 [Halobacteriovorax marinus]